MKASGRGIFTLVLAVFCAARVFAAEAKAPTGTAVSSQTVTILTHSAYWTDVFGLAPQSTGSAKKKEPAVLVVRGELRNVSKSPLHHVELQIDLLDSEGTVVLSESTYNYGAEMLRPA